MLRRSMIEFGNIPKVINIVCAKLQVNGRDVLNLPVAVAQPVPSRSLFLELIERATAPVTQIVRIQDGKFFGHKLVIRNTADAIGQRSPDLQANIRFRQITISPVGGTQNNVPER